LIIILKNVYLDLTFLLTYSIEFHHRGIPAKGRNAVSGMLIW